MDYKKVVVAGAGVLGSQIAYQIAYKGFDVTVWLRSEDSVERAKPNFENLYETYIKELEHHKKLIGEENSDYARGLIEDLDSLTEEKLDQYKQDAKNAFENIRYEIDLEKAVEDADILIEAMAEIEEQKTEFYEDLAKVLPEKTIITTNSSTMLPSTFAEATGRPEKYLAMHFANSIWRNNVCEIMAHEGTDNDNFEDVADFAEKIGMIPLRLQKEQEGYLLNSLLVPLLSASQALNAKEIASIEDIDKAWKYGTGAPMGPFEILDVVGLETAYNIQMAKPEAKEKGSVQAKSAQILKEMIDQGKTGRADKEGFYKYD